MKICPVCKDSFDDSMTFCANDGEVLEADPTSLVGQKLDNQYYVESLLGKGGMGAVYKARHILLGDLVAIKVLPPEMRNNTEWLKRFQREGQAARRFRHPNAVTVHDLRSANDGTTYLVMEYINGRTISADLLARGRYTAADAFHTLEPIMSVLHAAHMTGVIHRDLKPDNIMIGASPDGFSFVKLLDLGVAKMLPSDGQENLSGTQLTVAGQLLGTPFYMSPEQWGEPQRDNNEEVDGRADLYSLACVVYEMVAGHKPFYGLSMLELRNAHVKSFPTPLAQLHPDVSPAFSQTVMRALSKDRNDRHPNVQVFADDLREAVMNAGTATNYAPMGTGYDAGSVADTGAGVNDGTLVMTGGPDFAGLGSSAPDAQAATVVIGGDSGGATQTYETPGAPGAATVVAGQESGATESYGHHAAQTVVDTGGVEARATVVDSKGGNNQTALPGGPVAHSAPANYGTPGQQPQRVVRQEIPPTQPASGANLPPVAVKTPPPVITEEPKKEIVSQPPTPSPLKWLAVPLGLLLLVGVVAIAWFAFLRPAPGNTPGGTETAAASETLRYWLEVRTPAQKGQLAGAPTRTADGPFLSGQEFKFHFTAPANGYLYIIGPGENNTPTTFLTTQPMRETGNNTNRLLAGQMYTFPNDNWFTLDTKAGTEVFTLIFSATPVNTPAFLMKQAGGAVNTGEWEDFRAKFKANAGQANVSKANGAEPFVGIVAPKADMPTLFEIRLEHQ